jgi:hypothetical protein
MVGFMSLDPSLLLGADNKLFGTTMAGGKRNDGVVFEVKK